MVGVGDWDAEWKMCEGEVVIELSGDIGKECRGEEYWESFCLESVWSSLLLEQPS